MIYYYPVLSLAGYYTIISGIKRETFNSLNF